MTLIPTSLEDATINITQETRVKATIAVTFAALLEQLGPGNERPDGVAMPMTLEIFPGGRWLRELGEETATSGATFKQSRHRPCLK